jgi:hypothetical protein
LFGLVSVALLRRDGQTAEAPAGTVERAMV